VTQLLKKFPGFYKNPKAFSMFDKARELTWANWIQTT
jgi:hypothetical protein